MRQLSTWGALGLLAWSCSSTGSSSADVPDSMGGDARSGTTASEPASDGSPGGEANGSDAAPVDGSGSKVDGSEGSSETGKVEEPGELPLAAAPAPAGGSSEASEETPGEAEPGPPVATEPPPSRLENVLVFTRTTGFRHGSIGPGIEAMQRLGQQNGFAVQNTEDPADFNDQNLARYDVVLWLNTDSEVLNDNARRAFERYIRAGGGWVGVHAAAASEYGWAWYGQLLGAYFLGHPAIQPARVQVENSAHPSTAELPQSFTWQDEWYSFRSNPRASVQVLMTLDESSYGVGDLAMGDHPIAWYHEFDGGRAWYTALGHPNEAYTNPMFLRHLLGGIRWASGDPP